MNTIKAKLDRSDYEIYNSDYLNYQIDEYFLDEKLEEFYPTQRYKGLVPTLSLMEFEEESEVVWKRILPAMYQKTVCPILMCPDDCDFSCTIIVAEIESKEDSILWKKIGLDKTELHKNRLQLEQSEMIGTKVNWFEKIPPLTFDRFSVPLF
jgi:hypothetical protein